MNKYLCTSVCLIFTLISAIASADWAPESSAPYQLVNSHTDISVDKSGLATDVTEYEFKALNDEGRNLLVMRNIPYIPDAGTIQILKASSITDGVERKVDLKTIQKRSAKSDTGGINHLQELIIPFTNIKVGSSIKYTVKQKQTKNLINGLFSMQFSFGLQVPELRGSAKIISQIPLYVAVNDPWKILTTKESKKGNQYIFEMTQNKPIYKFPLELNPIIRRDLLSSIEISTMNSWNTYARSLSSKYEDILKVKNLPSSLEAIANKASKPNRLEDKINIVTSELATIMTYSGDWSSFDKMYFPKSLASIAAMKTGDCKDFSLATTAILRKIGINAQIAVTERKTSSPLGIVKVERLNVNFAAPFFNHAIVKVHDNDRTLWVDPTNIVSNADIAFNDIAGSYALELSAKSTALEVIPHPEANKNKVAYRKTLKINDDNTAESTTLFELSGDYSKYILETAFAKTEEAGKNVLMAYLRTDSSSGKSFYTEVDFKTRIADTISGTQKTIAEKVVGDKDSKRYLALPLPLSIRGFLSVEGNRKSDLNLPGRFIEDTVTKVQGYDFVNYQKGCVILTPWFVIQRNFFKIEDGFEVQDFIEAKSVEISAKDTNDDRFQMSLGDIQDCAASQAIEIKKIESQDTLVTRLKDYNTEKMKELRSAKGPASIKGAQEAYHIANQILKIDPKNKDALITKQKVLTRVGYKHSRVDNSIYEQASDEVLKVLMKEYPNDPAALIRKTYASFRKKGNTKEILDNFNHVYKISPKDYDLYLLGGDVADELKKYQAAIGSYSKAFAIATTNSQKASASMSIANTYSKMDDNEKAIPFFKQSLAFDPSDTWGQGHLLTLLSNLKRWDEAIDEGEKMIKTSDYGIGRRMVANAYAGKAKSVFFKNRSEEEFPFLPDKQTVNEVEGYLMKGLRHSSDNGDCLYFMGMLYYVMAQESNDKELAQKSLSYLERSEKVYLKDGKVEPNILLAKVVLAELSKPGHLSEKNARSPASALKK